MNIATGKIYSIKLVTGEEIVSKINKIDDTEILLDMPTTLMATNQGVQFIPSLISANEKKSFRLLKTSVVMYCETNEQAEAGYRKATTGIETPSKQIITG